MLHFATLLCIEWILHAFPLRYSFGLAKRLTSSTIRANSELEKEVQFKRDQIGTDPICLVSRHVMEQKK
jgi:hypothetical protein